MVNLDALAWVYPTRRMGHADTSIRDFAAAREFSKHVPEAQALGSTGW
jgi:hypothetical protein